MRCFFTQFSSCSSTSSLCFVALSRDQGSRAQPPAGSGGAVLVLVSCDFLTERFQSLSLEVIDNVQKV